MNYKVYKIHHSRGKSDTNFFQEKTLLNGAYASLKVLRVIIVNDIEKSKKKNSTSKNHSTKKFNSSISITNQISMKNNQNLNSSIDFENKTPESSDVLLTLIIRVLLFKQELDTYFFNDKLRCLKFHLDTISTIISKNIADFQNELIAECPKLKNNLIIKLFSNFSDVIVSINDTKPEDFYREIKDAIIIQWQKNINKVSELFEYYKKMNPNLNTSDISIESDRIGRNEDLEPINYDENKSKISNNHSKSFEDEFSEDPIVVSYLLSKKKDIHLFLTNITQGILFTISKLYYEMDYYSIVISSLIFKIFYGIMLFISSNKDKKEYTSYNEKSKIGKLFHIIGHIINLARSYSKNVLTREIDVEYCGLNSMSKFVLNNFVQTIPKCLGIKDSIDKKKFKRKTLYQIYSNKKSYKCYLQRYKKFDDNQLLKIFRLYYNSKLTFWKSIIRFKIEDIQSLTCRICLKKIPINELFLHVNYCIEQKIFYQKMSEFNYNFEHIINDLDCYLTKINQNLTPINRKLFGKGGYLFNIISRLPGCHNDEDGEIFIKSLIRIFKYEKSKLVDYYENKPAELCYVLSLGYFIYILYVTNKSSNETDQELSEILGKAFTSILQKIINIFIFLYTRRSKIKSTAMKDKNYILRKKGSRSKSKNNQEISDKINNISPAKKNDITHNVSQSTKEIKFCKNNDDESSLYNFRNMIERYKSKLSVNNMVLANNSNKKKKQKKSDKGILYVENSKSFLNFDDNIKNNCFSSRNIKHINNKHFSHNKEKSEPIYFNKNVSFSSRFCNKFDTVKKEISENKSCNKKNSLFHKHESLENNIKHHNSSNLIKHIFNHRSLSLENVNHQNLVLSKKQNNNNFSKIFLYIKSLFSEKIKIKRCISSGNIFLNKDSNSTKKSKNCDVENSPDSSLNNTNNIHILNYSESESSSDKINLTSSTTVETQNIHNDIDKYMSNVTNNNLSPIPISRHLHNINDNPIIKSSLFKNNNYNDNKKEIIKSNFNGIKNDIKNNTNEEDENFSYNDIFVDEEEDEEEDDNENGILKDKNSSNCLSVSDLFIESNKKMKVVNNENIFFSESSSDEEIERSLSNVILHKILYIDPESKKMINEDQITKIYNELMDQIDDKIITESDNNKNYKLKNAQKNFINNNTEHLNEESFIENVVNGQNDLKNIEKNSEENNKKINENIFNNNSQQKLKHIETPSRDEILNNENYSSLYNQTSTISSFKLLFPIAKGGYGSVALYKNIATGDFFAIKTVNINRMKDKHLSNMLQNEQTILKEVNNDYVVSSYFIFRDEKNYYFVMEYLPGGDVYTLLSKLFLPERAIQLIVAETILAVNYLHKICIIHHDIKPENILITKEGHFKLSDFGLSKALETNGKEKETLHVKNLQNFVDFKDDKFLTENETDQAVGTLNYMAPELFTDNYPAGIGIDYWAVGVVIFELFSFKVPFEAKTQKEVQENIINLNINWEPLTNKEIRNKYKNIDAAIDLIKKFLLLNPNDRWGDDNLNDIKNHPFFNGFNWDNIKNMRIPAVLKYLKGVVEETNKKITKVNEQNKNNPNKDEKSNEDCPLLIDINLTVNEEKYNFTERFDNLYKKNNEIIKKKLKKKEFDIEDNKLRDSFLLDLE